MLAMTRVTATVNVYFLCSITIFNSGEKMRIFFEFDRSLVARCCPRTLAALNWNPICHSKAILVHFHFVITKYERTFLFTLSRFSSAQFGCPKDVGYDPEFARSLPGESERI